MSRVLFNFTAALSLLLFMATAVQSVRSYWIGDRLGYDRVTVSNLRMHELSFMFISGQGGFRFSRFSQTGSVRPDAVEKTTKWADGRPRFALNHDRPRYPTTGASSTAATWDKLGFILWNDPIGLPWTAMGVQGGQWGVVLPVWFVAIVFTVLPLQWMILSRRNRFRNRTGVCQRCGYDLTGNVSGTCPECGVVIHGRTA